MPTLPSVSIRSLLMLVLLLLLAGSSVAQTRAKLERANRLLKERAFVDASKLYLEILDRHEVSEAKLNLAECYRLMGSSIEAEYWFGQSIQLSEAKPIDKLHYGMALQSNNKCEQAKRWFDEYARLNPDDLRGQMLSKACGTAVLNELLSKNTELFDVASMATINSNYRDYAPFIYKNGIAFVSERDKGIVDEKINAETNAPFSKLYYIAIDGVGDTARVAGKRYTRPIKLNELNSSLHDGPMSVTADGKRAILTRTNLYGRNDAGIRKNKIYWVVSLGGGHWSEPKTFAFNSDEYSTMHPAISPDGKVIYFASDMPGGFGGYDLYKTNYEDGRWSPPINLGPEINTEGNEGYPFVHASGDLYFSSNGRIGMGGQDVYVVKLGAEGTGEIINMGYPINSPSDDISFVMNANKTRGFFASNRNGDVSSDDIFSFTRTAVNVELLVVDKETGKAIGGARVMCECGTKSQNADAQGNYSIELPSSRNCEFIAGRDGYKSSSKVALTKGKAPGSTLHLKIELETERRREVLLTGVARTRDEQPLRTRDLAQLTESFPNLTLEGFQLFSMMRRVWTHRGIVSTLDAVDARCLQALPPLKKWCRYVVLTMTKS